MIITEENKYLKLSFDKIDWAERKPFEILKKFRTLGKFIRTNNDFYIIKKDDKFFLMDFFHKGPFNDEEVEKGEYEFKKFLLQFESDTKFF